MKIPGICHAGDLSLFAPIEAGEFCLFQSVRAVYRLGYSMANPS